MATQDTDLDALVREHLTPLRAFIASLAVHSDLVDDVAQDVFLEAFRHMDRYDSSRPFRAWLFGIAKNVVYQEFRKHSQNRRLREELTSEAIAQLNLSKNEVLEGFWGDHNYIHALQQCILSLPDALRELVALKFESGYKSHEIAEIVGKSAAAVRMSTMRARTALRDCIEKRLLENPS